jgi:hypothetical protein
MQINHVNSLAIIDGDWCGTGRPKLPIPPPKSGPLFGGGVLTLADDYCGNGKIPVPPKPGGGGPWGQNAL